MAVSNVLKAATCTASGGECQLELGQDRTRGAQMVTKYLVLVGQQVHREGSAQRDDNNRCLMQLCGTTYLFWGVSAFKKIRFQAAAYVQCLAICRGAHTTGVQGKCGDHISYFGTIAAFHMDDWDSI